MRLPGFTADAATVGPGSYFGMRGSYAYSSAMQTVAMAAQCCPTGFDTTGCVPTPPPDCTTTGCRKGLVCCDCTITHCTTPAQCRRECLL